MKILFLFVFSILSFTDTFSQTITLKGKITDEQGQAVPFASVYLKNTSKGTSANSEGEYQLKLVAGSYEVEFKSIGFMPQTRQLELKEAQVLNIVLKGEKYELTEVVIKSGGEDPAYAIIRKAIKQRKIYQQQLKPYSVEVYIKGLQKMLNAPKKFLGKNVDDIGKEIGLDSNRRGIVYLSESESKLSFLPPAEYKEEMIASKISGSNKSISFNRATDMQFDFNTNYQSLPNLTNRPIISPIADNALANYTYKLLGTSTENGVEINKIRVSPKRKGDPLLSGTIYIMEDTWLLHSADVYLDKDAGINLLDTMRIRQSFVELNQHNWRPASTRFDFTGGIFGFKFGGSYVAVYRNYVFDTKFSKKDFKEVMRVTNEVNKKDSTYWTQARPIPLTNEEKTDYEKKQVLADKKNSKTYRDSIDAKRNQFKPLAFMLRGYQHSSSFTKEYITLKSPLGSVFYNTVEGWGLDYGASYVKRIDTLNNRYLGVNLKTRYAFSSQSLNPSISVNIPLKGLMVGLSGGSSVQDMNWQHPVTAFYNSYYSLLYEKNYLKLYQQGFAKISASKRLIGGLRGYISADWADRKWLSNTTDFKWRDVENRVFTSNNPLAPASAVPLFPQNQSLSFFVNLSYNFSDKYVTYPSGKYFIPSKYPTVNLSFKAAVKGVLGSDVSYQLVSLGVNKDDIPMGLYGKSSFMAGAGEFFNTKSIFYTDYVHFSGNQSVGYEARSNSFLFLNLYSHSTSQQYVEGHYQHNFSGLLTNKLPLIRKLKLKEIVGANYLSTPSLKNYAELYFGLKYLNMTAQYGFSYRDGRRSESGFRLGFSL